MNTVIDHITPGASSDKSQWFVDPLDLAIARMSDADISRMDRDELIDLVSYSALDRQSTEDQAHLRFVDDAQLKRLACLARRACRRKVKSAFLEQGIRCPFIECI